MRTGIWSFIFAVGLSLGANPASALVFDVWSCTPDESCNLYGARSTMPGSSGPANADFQSFYGLQLGVDLSDDTFTWVGNTTANGDEFGTVGDTSFGIHSAYLWWHGALMCCTIDDPYEIVDGNARGLFIGNDITGTSNAGEPVYPAFLASAGGPYALSPVEFELSPKAADFLAALGNPDIRFVVLGDFNDILAQWDGGWLEFAAQTCCGPISPQPAEPAGALIVLPALALMWSRRRR